MIFKVTGAILLLLVLFFIVSCENDGTIEFRRYYSVGAEIYQTHCQNCHGANGEGLAALIPPLNDSLYLKNNKTSLACYVKSGLKGQITINGKIFDDNMQANKLGPMELAQVLTYVNNSFGNKLGVMTIDEVNVNIAKCP